MKTLKNKIPKPLRNIYLWITAGFLIWIFFVDANSFLFHQELNQEINDLESEKAFYQREIEKDKKELENLSTEEGIERVAREEFYMKKENEDIYLIEYQDSIAKSKQDE